MEIIASETQHVGVKFDLAVHTLLTARGERLEREYCVSPGSVVLVPVLPDDQVVMVRQFRHAIEEELLELPAGTSEPGESDEETARRELREETGFDAGRLRRLLRFHPAPGITNETMTLLLAERLSPGPPQPEVDEEMRVEIVPLATALAMCGDGRIRDAKSMLGLWHYDRMRSESLAPKRSNH